MSRSTREVLNEGNQNKLGAALNVLPMGEAIALVPRTFRGPVVGDVLVLPEVAKASAILAAYGEGGTDGYKTPQATGTLLVAGQVAPNGGGDVEFDNADAIVTGEVQYLAYEGPIIEDLIVPVVNQGTFLGLRIAGVLLSVEVLAGATTGFFAIVTRGTAPAGGQASIGIIPTIIDFNAADVVTSVRVRYVAQPGVGSTAQAVGLSLDDVDKNF